MGIVARGARGDAVLDIQARLSALGYHIDPGEHGHFGQSTERAVREFQQRRQIIVDGAINDHSWAELVEAGYSLGDRVLYLRYPYFRGDDVRTLQSGLNLLGFDAGREDGILGERTDRAIREFQRNVGLRPDGIPRGETDGGVGKHLGHFGVGMSDSRENDILARRKTFEARGQVDGAAEIV